LSQTWAERRYSIVNGLTGTEIAVDIPDQADFDLESLFRAHYRPIANVIARLVRDRGRAEELAVEVFLKFSRHRKTHSENADGWLYRAAVRVGLDDLRRHTRRLHYESLLGFAVGPRNPEELHAATEEREKVRRVLGVLARREAELLLLRSHGLSYEELASALDLNPASVGTLLSRAQNAFRKEYVKRYGEELD
jgi:RNA polymerase sigma-70 factor (ECF subfamily)